MSGAGGASVWRDRVVSSPAEWQLVAQEYRLRELQVRAFSNKHHRPRAIESDEVLLVTFVVPMLRGFQLKERVVSVIVTPHETVTVHEGTLPFALAERLAVSSRMSASPSGVLAVIADAVTEAYAPVLDKVDDQIDILEDIMVNNPTDKELHTLFQYKRLLADLRRIVLPTTSMLDAMSDGRFVLIEEEHRPYIRDSYDYSWRTHELIDTMRDLLTSALDTYLSVVSNRLNDVMKRLTMVATIFMPISFVVGFGGMNFTAQIPFDNPIMFALVISLIVLVPLTMLGFFKYKKWF